MDRLCSVDSGPVTRYEQRIDWTGSENKREEEGQVERAGEHNPKHRKGLHQSPAFLPAAWMDQVCLPLKQELESLEPLMLGYFGITEFCSCCAVTFQPCILHVRGHNGGTLFSPLFSICESTPASDPLSIFKENVAVLCQLEGNTEHR